MIKNTTITRPVTAISPMAARLSIVAATVTLVLLAALHGLSPEVDPSWRMVSEYALGNYGWVLALMFLSWALSCVALFFAIKPHLPTLRGKIGLGFLLAAAVGMSMAAIFDARHDLHGLAAIIGMPSLPVAAVLMSLSLARRPAWLLGTAHLTWLSLVLMFAAVFIGLSQSGGEFGPQVQAGWPNRLLVVAYCVWLLAAARYTARLSER